MNFDQILQNKLDRHKNIFVTVNSSPHWNQVGRFWLSQFCAKKIKSFGKVPIIISENIENFPHKEFQIISYDVFLKEFKEGLIVYSVSHNCPFATKLGGLANFESIDLTAYSIEPSKVGIKYTNDQLDKISLVYGLLADADSQACFTSLLSARLTGDVRVIKKSPYPIYFHPTFKKENLRKGNFIDGGAFDGKESLKFKSLLEERCKVLAYEFDGRNYDKYLKNLSDEKVIFLNQGLWSKKSSGTTSGQGIGSRVTLGSENDPDAYTLVSIDEEHFGKEPVSFIKMDIEGAEIEAINGSIKVIEKDNPYISISVYHQPTDIFEIPILINSINPNYRYYLGQHDKLLSETVLYCVPKLQSN
jgi:FkbM family methyltransferase